MSEMWGGRGNDNAGGGYFGNEFKSSPGGAAGGEGGEKKVYKAQNCVPVTVAHILRSTEDNFKVGKHSEAHVITILGRLLKKSIDTTKMLYTIDDGTGVINCFDFKYNESDNSAVKVDLEINQYYRVFGSLRMAEGVHHVMLFRIQPMESINELTMHLLEVIYAPLHLDEMEDNLNSFNRKGNAMENSMADINMSKDFSMGGDAGGGSTNILGFTRAQQAVYEMVKNCSNTEKGLNEASIPEGLPMKISLSEVKVILEFLVSEGHVYTTTDCSHYRTTDA